MLAKKSSKYQITLPIGFSAIFAPGQPGGPRGRPADTYPDITDRLLVAPYSTS